MDIIEEYIEKIILHSSHSREDILKRIKQIKEEHEGLTDIGAVYRLKKELGFDFSVKLRKHDGESYIMPYPYHISKKKQVHPIPWKNRAMPLDRFKWKVLRSLAREKEMSISQIIKEIQTLTIAELEEYLEDLIERNLVQQVENDQIYSYNLENKYAKSLRVNILLELDHPVGDHYKSGFDTVQGELFFWYTERKQPGIGYEDSMKETVRRTGCSNIFCYSGDLFPYDNVLVIGSRNLTEAISIIFEWLIYELDNPKNYDFVADLIYYLWEKTFPDEKLYDFLRKDLSNNTEKGWCDTKEEEGSLQGRLRRHLEVYKKLGDSMFDGPSY
ncbi:MAG: hypothetical protein ACFFA3_21350 [Promethearchaeota archaeon]